MMLGAKYVKVNANLIFQLDILFLQTRCSNCGMTI